MDIGERGDRVRDDLRRVSERRGARVQRGARTMGLLSEIISCSCSRKPFSNTSSGLRS